MTVDGPLEGEAQTLQGAGATFPAPLYTRWFEEYRTLTGVEVNYQAVGSGAGIRAISDGTADFGATDSPMSDEQLAEAQGGPLFHIPAALGAVVPTYNVPEAPGVLNFTAETLAGIFLGDITTWNDPLLVAANPDLANVDQNILVVHRSDGSGTTSIWVDYLSTVNPTWEETVGRGTSVDWPTGIGAQGNQGVSGEVLQNPYSIGYVELIYALQNDLGLGHVENRAGNFVEPNLESVTAAADGIAETIAPDLRASIVDAEGEDTYPIAGFTWLLAYEEMEDLPTAQALTRMLWWATHDGQEFNAELGYAPVPEAIVEMSDEMIQQITVDGEAVFPVR